MSVTFYCHFFSHIKALVTTVTLLYQRAPEAAKLATGQTLKAIFILV